MKSPGSDFYSRVQQIGILTTVPFILCGGVLLGYFAGQWLDKKFGWSPYGKMVMIVVWTAASFIEVVRMIRRVQRLNRDTQ